MTKIDKFLEGNYPPGSYNYVLKKFLKKRRHRVSEHTIARMFYNLHPIGCEWKRPFKELERAWLKPYIDRQWLKYAPATMRTLIGDVRDFSRWVKKKGHHKRNIAKYIRPVQNRNRRNKRARAAPEEDVFKVMKYLAKKLETAVYRDDSGVLHPKPKLSIHQTKAIRDLFIFILLYETGARVGELAKLGSRAINTAMSEPRKTYLITANGKSNDRDRWFTERTAEFWRVWQQVRPEGNELYAVVGWGNGRPVNPLKAHSISCMIHRRCIQAGVRPFRGNALRHSKAKRSRKLVGLEMASQLLDHSTIETTKGYANFGIEELEKAALLTGLQHKFFE
ncbi:MAG: site-specific integrase [Chloroflexi bacterium]|nr:site-specific integrase [Chloroflexota bacterium]